MRKDARWKQSSGDCVTIGARRRHNCGDALGGRCIPSAVAPDACTHLSDLCWNSHQALHKLALLAHIQRHPAQPMPLDEL